MSAPVAPRQVKDWGSVESPLDHVKQRDSLYGSMSLAVLKALPFEKLGGLKLAESVPVGYPPEQFTFYAPRDLYVHSVIVWALLQATHTVAVNVYGFDDDLAAAILCEYGANPDIFLEVNLDKSQAGGVHEKPLLAALRSDIAGNSIAVGNSVYSAISHDKLLVVDNLYLITGSTNWSESGEEKQDNQLTIVRNPVLAGEARAIIDINHDAMLEQQAKAAK